MPIIARRIRRAGSGIAAALVCAVGATGPARPAEVAFELAGTVRDAPAESGRVVGDFKPNGVALVDLDEDGKLDIVAAYPFDDVVTVFRGEGGGKFARLCAVAVEPRPIGFAFGDWNGDGAVDAAVTSYNRQGAALLSGGGTGCLEHTGFVAGGHSPQAVATGDWNGDGRADLAISNRNSHTVSIRLGGGDGSFAAPKSGGEIGVGRFPSGIVAGDWNGDGAADLAVVNHYSHSVSILLGDGRGRFSVHGEAAIGLYPGDIDTADLNGDGQADLIAVNVRNNDLSVLLGKGTGDFVQGERLKAGEAPAGIAIADLDGDGRSDIVVAMRDAPELIVYCNEGGTEPSFRRALVVATADNPIDVAVGDLDADGRIDLVAYLPGLPAVSVFLNRTPIAGGVNGG